MRFLRHKCEASQTHVVAPKVNEDHEKLTKETFDYDPNQPKE
jgi:hypothetical protein